MVPGRLSPTEAGWIALAGLLLLPVALIAPLIPTVGRMVGRIPLLDVIQRMLRSIGLVGLGAAFFLFWTLVYLALWWFDPEDAFQGLDRAPYFADFFYYAVSTAFISPPGDIVASTRGARSATMIEMLTGFALLAAYLASFVDWGRVDDEKAR
jgi:hypothetical protein